MMLLTTKRLGRVAVTAVLLSLVITSGMADDSLDGLKSMAPALNQQEQWAEAADAYTRLTEAEPEDASHWVGLARATRGLEDYDKAIAFYEKALALDPNSGLGLMGMAITLELQDQVERAFEYLQRAAQQGFPTAVFEQSPAFAGLREHSQQFAKVLEVAQFVASPCLHEDPYDDFDFWVGDWDVHLAGKKQAENVVTKEMNGCIIRERYHDDFGSRGESINYYDPETKTWKQNWVDAGGGIVRYSGGLEKSGVMHMEGTNTRADGTHKLARVTWTRLPDGKVHHVIQHSTDDGKTWTVAFDGTYVLSDRAGG